MSILPFVLMRTNPKKLPIVPPTINLPFAWRNKNGEYAVADSWGIVYKPMPLFANEASKLAGCAIRWEQKKINTADSIDIYFMILDLII
jgi:hypothetical protein